VRFFPIFSLGQWGSVASPSGYATARAKVLCLCLGLKRDQPRDRYCKIEENCIY